MTKKTRMDALKASKTVITITFNPFFFSISIRKNSPVEKAIKATGIKNIAIAGGVSANSALREGITNLGTKYGCEVFIPKFSYTTDNAAMVAAAGLFKYIDGEFADLSLTAYAR